jgi:uncharacterized protein YbaA (DUF1428 family)
MPYVDGYLLVVPKKNVKAYAKMARLGKRVWLDHGALDYNECVLSFPKLAKAKKTDTVFFSYVVYTSRKHRDKVNSAVMRDPRLSAGMDPTKMPFDVRKMSMGGFQVLVGGKKKSKRT